MSIFDANVFFGPYHRQDIDAAPETVIRQMDELLVGRALAVSLFAVEHDVLEGNEQILGLARRWPERLEPVAVVNPSRYLPDRGLGHQLRSQGFRVAAFYPVVQGWPPELLSFRLAAVELAAAGLPIMVAVGRYGEASRVAQALEGLRTTVILRLHAGGGYGFPDEFIAVGKAFPNFCFDVWNFVGAGQIRLLAEEVGHDRLVCGSGIPLCCGRSSQFLLQTAGLDETQQGPIAGGTLSKVLGYGESPGRWAVPPADPVLSRPKIDVHYHLGEWNLPMANTSASGAVADFDTFGFQYGLMSSSAALRGSAAAGNAVVAQALELDPRMKGYVYLDPYHPEQSAEDLERYAAHEGFVGIKTRPDYHGTTLEHPAYQPLLRRAVELKMPLLTHNCAVRRAVESVPGLQVVVAHSSAATARDYADLPNVCFCTASSSPFMQGEEVRKMIDTVGVDRILFGSDGPLISAAWNLGRFASSRFSVDEAEKIYAANALRVFQRLPKLHSRRSAACERGDR